MHSQPSSAMLQMRPGKWRWTWTSNENAHLQTKRRNCTSKPEQECV